MRHHWRRKRALLVPATEGARAVRALFAHGWEQAETVALDDALCARHGLALVRPALDDAELTVQWRAERPRGLPRLTAQMPASRPYGRS